MDISKLSKSELDTLQMELLNKRIEARNVLSVVVCRDKTIALDMSRMNVTRKELAEPIEKAKSSLGQIEDELAIVKLQMWKKIAEGEC